MFVRELWKKIWLPALLFAIAGPVSLATRDRYEPIFDIAALAYAVTVVRAVWWTCTRKQEQVDVALGMGVGALCGAIVVSIPIIGLILYARVSPPGEGGIATMMVGMVLVIAFLVSMPVGMVIGGLTPLVQRWIRSSRPLGR